MTVPQPPAQSTLPAASQQPNTAGVGKAERTIAGLIALVASAIGFIFACIPGALIVGWILLPIGFILGIVSLFLKGKVKWRGITAIIVSLVGAVVAVIVFSVVVATPSNGSGGEFGQPTTTATEDAGGTGDDEAPAEAGTRENPLPLGTPFSSGDWTVTVNSVILGAQEQILAAVPSNAAPDAGTEYLLMNITLQYTGTDAEGGKPALIGIEYVPAVGAAANGLGKTVAAPDEIDVTSLLNKGASVTGNRAIQVPAPADGVLAIRPGTAAGEVFFAIQ